jgi:protein ImuB
LTSPTRSVPHVARLIELKLDALAAMHDAGFGFEAIDLAVTRAEAMAEQQTELNVAAARLSPEEDIERNAALIDALRHRLGPDRVRQFEAVHRHIPEHAETLTEVNANVSQNSPFEEKQARPLLLLPQAEPTEVTALIPDGPPRRFRWRGVTYDITGAQGPERIADEWWRAPYPPAQTGKANGLSRDYYLVEDNEGQRFWLYREGLYGREIATPRWFVHGLFA